MKVSIKLLSVLILLIGVSFCSCEKDKSTSSSSGSSVAAPTDLSVSTITEFSAKLSWEGNADSYEIVVGDESYTSDSNSYTVEDLEAGTDYSWKIRAKEGNEYSSWVNGDDFTTLGGVAGFVIEAENVQDDYTGDIAEVAATHPHPHGYGYKLASAEYKNNGFKLTLPSTVPSVYLRNIADDLAGKDIQVSDKNANVVSISISAYDEYGDNIGKLCLEDRDENVDVEYIYADRKVTVKGADEDYYYRYEYDLSFKTGWNMMYYVFSYSSGKYKYLITTQKPSGINPQWYYYEYEKSFQSKHHSIKHFPTHEAVKAKAIKK